MRFYVLILLMSTYSLNGQALYNLEDISWYDEEILEEIEISKSLVYKKLIASEGVDLHQTEMFLVMKTTIECDSLDATNVEDLFLECNKLMYYEPKGFNRKIIDGEYLIYENGQIVCLYDPRQGVHWAPDDKENRLYGHSLALKDLVFDSEIIFTIEMLPLSIYFGVANNSLIIFEDSNEERSNRIDYLKSSWFDPWRLFLDN